MRSVCRGSFGVRSLLRPCFEVAPFLCSTFVQRVQRVSTFVNMPRCRGSARRLLDGIYPPFPKNPPRIKKPAPTGARPRCRFARQGGGVSLVLCFLRGRPSVYVPSSAASNRGDVWPAAPVRARARARTRVLGCRKCRNNGQLSTHAAARNVSIFTAEGTAIYSKKGCF